VAVERAWRLLRERRALVEHDVAVVAVAVSEEERLGDEPAGPDEGRRLQQVGGAAVAQLVGPVEVPVHRRRARERRRLVDHRIGAAPLQRGEQAGPVEDVGLDAGGAECPQPSGAALGPRQPDHVVARVPQLRYECGAQRPGGSGDDHLHTASLISSITRRIQAAGCDIAVQADRDLPAGTGGDGAVRVGCGCATTGHRARST
jgi:hypothetical protein